MQINNQHHLIQIISSNHSEQILEIKFLETGIMLPISKDILLEKVNEGFYRLVDSTAK